MQDKFELTDETREIDGTTVYRIRALRDIPGTATKGTLGGFVESENNLSYSGAAWVADEAAVYGGASVRGNALVVDNATVYGDAALVGNAVVLGNAQVSGNAVVRGAARIFDRVRVCGWAIIEDFARVLDTSVVQGFTQIYGGAHISGDAQIDGDVEIGHGAVSCGAIVRQGNHVLTLTGWLPRYDLTVYRTATGHTVKVGCQRFTLDDDFRTIADNERVYLPDNWQTVHRFLSETVANWH